MIWQILLVFSVFFIKKYFKAIAKLFGFFAGPNPFLKDSTSEVKQKVSDQKLRDAVLKQNFKKDKIPDKLDAIIIGSGIGGLSTAAILSKIGKKVLVLEQHDQSGGTCHTFIEKGYEFDVGIHYIGKMNYQSFNKTYLDQISDGQIQWADLDDDFDTVVFKDGDKMEKFPIYSNLEKTKKNLKKEFPEDENAIDKYYELVQKVDATHNSSMVVKFLPLFLVIIIDSLGLIGWISEFYEYNSKSVAEVVNGLTKNQTLRDIFCYCFGDYGTTPSSAGFPMQATLMNHFVDGASYPVGGASEIAFNIIPVIERAGGKVFVNAHVSKILIDSNGAAHGVKVKHGTQEHDLFAPLIISNAGIYNTMERFLPSSVAAESRLMPFVKKTKHGVGAISVFVGMNATAEEMELPTKKNFWLFTKKNIDKACITYLEEKKENCEDVDVPLLFISFPSTKDPLWDERYKGKSTMAIVTLTNYDWFSDYEGEPCKRRSDEYEAMKKTIGHKTIEHACQMFPKIRDHIDYVNIGTPLSNNFYLGSTKGEIYGLDHTQSRFSLLNNALLRPETDIPGLYLTGQDICSAGFTGALFGGLLCAQQILGRNLVNDLISVHKDIIKKQKKAE